MEDKILAYAGHENLKKTNIVRKTRSPIVHERYDFEEIVNDIALVYLPRALPLGKNVMRIIITKSFPLSTKGTIAGWGVINDLTNEETILLKAITQTVKSKRTCSRVTSGPGMLCAGSLRSSDPRPAEGDSGSGLITQNYQLIGLLSYKMTALPALPVYTNVSYYYNWIKYHIKKRCMKN
ncbi:transmembrane protease serine 11C-like [Bicyclus anynana]|uniref:Transmembrane protease serine 11C-like n=1 Tax=Bicyclus anynana TaxID=110368 RepID=A0A6J1PAQ0_BICAN|nr:transmembrane protease serine 11C-like [Bicyclus anynana]